MKTLIAIPCMDMVHTQFMKSVIGMNRVDDTRFAISCSSLIYDARNTLAKQAVTENYDRVLWLDSDMDLPPDILTVLSKDMDEGRELVSGIYFKRRAPVKPVIYKEVGYYHSEEDESVTPIAVSYEDYPQNSIFPIQGCGFGGCLVSVDLIKKVVDKYGLPFSPIMGFGEDLSFCMRAKTLGVEMFCDSSVKLGHVGLGTITEETYLSMR